MIKRTLTERLRALFTQYPVVTITGPRQSGKTTLCRETFPALIYTLADRMLAVEIKAGETVTRQFFTSLHKLQRLLPEQVAGEIVVYGGIAPHVRQQVHVTLPSEFTSLLDTLETALIHNNDG